MGARASQKCRARPYITGGKLVTHTAQLKAIRQTGAAERAGALKAPPPRRTYGHPRRTPRRKPRGCVSPSPNGEARDGSRSLARVPRPYDPRPRRTCPCPWPRIQAPKLPRAGADRHAAMDTMTDSPSPTGGPLATSTTSSEHFSEESWARGRPQAGCLHGSAPTVYLAFGAGASPTPRHQILAASRRLGKQPAACTTISICLLWPAVEFPPCMLNSLRCIIED